MYIQYHVTKAVTLKHMVGKQFPFENTLHLVLVYHADWWQSNDVDIDKRSLSHMNTETSLMQL